MDEAAGLIVTDDSHDDYRPTPPAAAAAAGARRTADAAAAAGCDEKMGWLYRDDTITDRASRRPNHLPNARH